mmetsp:Transcript_31900/g.68720  ORF Transcript_31900/g.68720 Transcript_31900/m.68720 type:complete len:217 (-) Transcript_31900:22-672(-)
MPRGTSSNPGKVIKCCTTAPRAAIIATRPCFNSATRNFLKSSSLLQSFAGSQKPRGGNAPTAPLKPVGFVSSGSGGLSVVSTSALPLALASALSVPLAFAALSATLSLGAASTFSASSAALAGSFSFFALRTIRVLLTASRAAVPTRATGMPAPGLRGPAAMKDVCGSGPTCPPARTSEELDKRGTKLGARQSPPPTAKTAAPLTRPIVRKKIEKK